MFCHKCGTKNKSGAIFCIKCGNKLGTASSTSKPKTGKSHINTKIIAVIVIIVVILVLGFWVYRYGETSSILSGESSNYHGANVYVTTTQQTTTTQTTISTTTIQSTSTFITTSSTQTTTQTTSLQPTTIIPETIALQCIPFAEFNCGLPEYNNTDQIIKVNITQSTGANWNGADIVFVPVGTTFSDGIPQISFTSYPAQTALQNITWDSGTKLIIFLVASNTENVNGAIWIRYKPQGSTLWAYVEVGTISPSASSSNYYTSTASTTIYYTTSIPQSYTTTATTTIQQTESYGCSPSPCTYTRNGNFTFLFTFLNGSVDSWTFPITSYNYYLTLPRIDPIIRLNDTVTGKTIYTEDYRSTITPSFFANVTPLLTNGRTAGQFVEEVQNINSQLVNYNELFLNTSVYPAQLLGQGEGDCKDKGVLMASILEAGNIQANYGMKIQFVYVDADNLTAPQTVNHLMLYITYANGTKEFLDTTHVLATSPYFNGTVDGWYYNLTCTMSGCQSTPLCTGSYCDAVGYASGSDTGFNYCSSSTKVVGNDNLCHTTCGGVDYYCNNGYSCNYHNECIS